MDIRPRINFANRITLREFDAELWGLYFGFVKGLLMVAASLVYFPLVCAFFLIQNAAFGASKLVAWVTEWNPVKPRAFELRSVDGD